MANKTTRHKKILVLLIIIIILFLKFDGIKFIGKLIYPIKYEEYIIKYSNQYELDYILVASVIRVESKYKKDAQSHRGARGLMQITLGTGRWVAEEIGISEYSNDLLYDPEMNILIGCWYLNKLKDQFQDNIPIVLAAYNGGSGNVSKWLKDERYSDDGKNLKHIPFKETEEYVEKVRKQYKIYEFLYN